MACEDCRWENAEKRAREIAIALPEHRGGTIEFLEAIADTIAEKKHVTEKQLVDEEEVAS